MQHPTLGTDRLILRPFLLTDASDIYRLNVSEQVMRFLPKDEVYTELAQAEQFLSAYIEKSAGLKFVRQAVLRKADGKWLGWCGLRKQENGEIDLGFRLHQSEWGRGYATESGRAWVDYGFTDGGLNRIVARAADENAGSRRVLEKLDFQRLPAEDGVEDGFLWRKYLLEKRFYRPA